ncbi:pilus assembly protein TadG-related protein [Arthrobacter sp. TMT4-20]
MRRLKDEATGAIAVTTALLMVLVLGMTALVVDVGMVYFERAQLQNGADAAALAVAQDCAAGDCGLTKATATANTFAGNNANDGKSIATVDTPPGEYSVTVQTSTLTEDGEAAIQHWFAPILGIDSTAVSASAEASWGSPIVDVAPFPMTFSKCEIQMTGDLEMIHYQKKDSGTPGCPGGPPGGFGKLEQDSGMCGATVNDDGSVDSDNGNSVPNNCDDLLASWATDIKSGSFPIGLFPIHDSVNDKGKSYGLAGFAAFEVYGWKWKQGGSDKAFEEFRSAHYSGMNCGKDICLIGKFVNKVLLNDDYAIGPPNGFGVTVVKLTG